MSLTCHKCNHQWDEDVPAGQTVVLCPECMAVVPLAIAGQGRPGASAEKKATGGEAGGGTVVQAGSFGSTPATPKAAATPASGDPKQYGGLIQESGLFSVQELKGLSDANKKSLFTVLRGMIDRLGPDEFLKEARDPESRVNRYLDQKVRPEYKLQPKAGGKTVARPAPARPATPAEEMERTAVEASGFGSGAISTPTGSTSTPSGTVITPMDKMGPVQLTPTPGTQGSAAKSATPSQTGSTRQAAQVLKELIGRTLDGYRIQKPLGMGGMGAVFLARQISLERDVAFKVLSPKLSGNADFLARFTREALSAAQLSHHNIIQVFDVGSVDDIHFITMEFVRGESLSQMVRRDGRLQVDDAAAYVLQAARGLKYAHDQGIIHRDIKPDNLMVNEHGVVKIADMGLAKRIGALEKAPAGGGPVSTATAPEDAHLTRADIAMGTPAYIAPEQARDAGSAGAQADQYSLGCTLYYLCAGATPYSGKTAFELISKHLNEPFTPLDVHVSNVPPALSVILTRMLEKEPAKRFSDMGEVVRVLESYLGVDSEKGPYTPREHHLAVLERAEKEYYAAPAVKLRKLATTGFFAAMSVLVLAAVLFKMFGPAGGLIGLLVMTPLANFIIDGVLSKTYLFRRVRAVFFGMPLVSWVKTVGGGLVVLAVLLVLGWLPFWLGFAVLAAGLAAAYRWRVVYPLRVQRAESIHLTQEMLKELRVRGVAEEALHDFMCRFGGVEWEEFFEEFFGYEAMVLARGKWAKADKVKPRKARATWREPLVRWLESVEEARKEARHRKTLAKAEAGRLKATGMDEKEAEKQADLATTKIMKDGLFSKQDLDRQRQAKIDQYYEGQHKEGPFSARRIFPYVRLVFALGLIVGWAAAPRESFSLPVPGFIGGLLGKVGYYEWGLGESIIALIAAILLIGSAFTRAFVPPVLVCVGAALLIGRDLLIEAAQQPMLTQTTAFAIGCVVLGMGTLMQVLGRKR